MNLINALKSIGFTQQESIIYITLCKHGELSGYEAAKLSGISRSNAYAALSSLVDKGNAHIIEGTSAKYIAISKKELIMNASRDFNQNIKIIKDELEFNQVTNNPYITIVDSKNIINKIKNMILQCEFRLYFCADKKILDLFANEIEDAYNKNKKIVILSPEVPTFNHNKYYKSFNYESFKLIIDTEEVITGTLSQALYSRNRTLVRLIREAIMNEIKLIDINNEK
ncbi:TrmB family transcriptional regulator [Vallitalea longa]|uniref:TrmB family transcriptional regulator n=1 Tax=Vallitalea longa TaxID=2936439 RepID=A0A9W6DGY6_9FIRM|nr:TrmB family transcriptional regulator [Vallitalea longa]GKX30918.1 TrmB family transcriptional regulator [Vallitalea longa]